MGIRPPSWCHGAVPGKNGWEDPNSGETLVSVRFTRAQIDEYYGVPSIAEVSDLAEQVAIEEVDNSLDLDSMTKSQLLGLVAEQQIEVDPRKSRRYLLEVLSSIPSK